jgi:fatty acid synthase, bacteria type
MAALDLIPLPAAIRLVYQRGRIMQQCITRDATGRSPYGMVVVRPHIMRQSESTLHELVAHVRSRHTQTLEIANYNILDEQYAVVGSHSALGSLTERCIALAKSQGVQRNPVRSVPGIDIPFHSSLLRKSVPQFAEHVRRALPASRDVTALAQRYIPNVTGRPFDGCAEQLHEYLAHQLASPVQWITTQHTLLCDAACRVDAVIEFGPNPVLGAMLSRSASLFAHAVTTAVYHQHELLGYAA